MEEKICISCKIPKPEDDYYTRTDNGKKQNTCKACIIEADRQRDLKKKNPIVGPKPEDVPNLRRLHCNKCNADKTEDCFSERPDRPGKHYTTCKGCRNEIEAEKRMRTTNKRKKYFSENDFVAMTDLYNQ